MTKLDPHVTELINQPGKIGILATADKEGKPNLAYFGSARILPEDKLILTLGNNRTLSNLEQNQKAVLLVMKGSPVTFSTPGYRLYLQVLEIHKDGEVLISAREHIAQRTGAKAAESLKAAIIFEITEVRSLID